ncbi:TetR family transcriptional regulator [Frankia sp. AgB1.9]|uniref:TetR/AcrR family transcriptional regulator n=1 Tax=unclassified Frankia TaxID=2632575 RepID=UPI0019326DCF|nr:MULTISPECIES: TetR family transcriptional regulator [unclassified Frankia]MBL7486858.1 TetR family transcriptional regulator [Frankia sp. AgW1.1]MBL7549769.1 TetR family transcriptional regulator [Frankia sp. AgB1.9]MBL7622921.1 TetR family transcriptional regulator [Frankia sp. AgB1.8]
MGDPGTDAFESGGAAASARSAPAGTAVDPAGPTPRAPRAEVRRRLLAAAASVFAERGYGESRLDDVARVAGFTKGAVYSNFGSKQQLFAELVGAHMAEQAAAVRGGVTSATDPDGTDPDRTDPDRTDRDRVQARGIELMGDYLVSDDRGQRLMVEFAAQASRDSRIQEAWAPHRRAHQEAVVALLAERLHALGLSAVVDLDTLALIMIALRNGLALERAAAPDQVDRLAIERAVAAVLTSLIPPTADRDA